MKHRPVDFVNNGQDRECMIMIGCGTYYSGFIVRRTGLTIGQVNYRSGLLKDFGVSRGDIRRGESPLSTLILAATRQVVDERVMSYLRKNR